MRHAAVWAAAGGGRNRDTRGLSSRVSAVFDLRESPGRTLDPHVRRRESRRALRRGANPGSRARYPISTVPAHDACGDTLSADEVEILDEADVVDLILCRLDQLKRAGCATPDCTVVAGRVDVSLEAAVDLVARGCPPELVLRILL